MISCNEVIAVTTFIDIDLHSATFIFMAVHFFGSSDGCVATVDASATRRAKSIYKYDKIYVYLCPPLLLLNDSTNLDETWQGHFRRPFDLRGR